MKLNAGERTMLEMYRQFRKDKKERKHEKVCDKYFANVVAAISECDLGKLKELIYHKKNDKYKDVFKANIMVFHNYALQIGDENIVEEIQGNLPFRERVMCYVGLPGVPQEALYCAFKA
jgi:hypothetical protein